MLKEKYFKRFNQCINQIEEENKGILGVETLSEVNLKEKAEAFYIKNAIYTLGVILHW